MKRLLLDIETSPNTALVWGMFNQNIGINHLIDNSETLCWSAKWYGSQEIMFDSKHISDSWDMVRRIHNLLNEADAVIHYNGTKFDIPVLNKEFLIHGFPPPEPYRQIDLYKVVKSTFKFPSNKLDYVLRALGMSQKVPTKGMELWIDCMNGNEEAWQQMEEYNIQDVKVMEPLYERLLPWITNHPNHALYMDTDRPVCRNCGSPNLHSRGYRTTKTNTQKYQRFECQDCGKWNRARYTEVGKDERHHILV